MYTPNYFRLINKYIYIYVCMYVVENNHNIIVLIRYQFCFSFVYPIKYYMKNYDVINKWKFIMTITCINDLSSNKYTLMSTIILQNQILYSYHFQNKVILLSPLKTFPK